MSWLPPGLKGPVEDTRLFLHFFRENLWTFFTFCFTEEDVENFDVTNLSQDMLRSIEADSFWCMSKLLDGIQVSDSALSGCPAWGSLWVPCCCSASDSTLPATGPSMAPPLLFHPSLLHSLALQLSKGSDPRRLPWRPSG